MALVWAEPWDQYGGNNNAGFVGSFGYADVSNSGFSNGAGRTGNYCVDIFNSAYMRRALDVSVGTLGIGAAINLQAGIVGNNWQNIGFRWDSAGKTQELSAVCMPDNSIAIYDRNNVKKGQTNPNKLIIGSYVWVEVKAVKGAASTGTVEVRVNGVSELIINGMDLPNDFAYASVGGSTGGYMRLDDWIVWDGTGAYNNDFLGDRRLFVSYPNANAVTQDFTPTPAGNAWDRINDAPPTGAPADSAYIEGAAAGNISEFAKGAIGIASTDVAAVVCIGRLGKSDAGTADARVGINSAGFVSNGAQTPVGTTFAWYKHIVERDPNGGGAWSRAAVDAANLRITRAA